MYQFFNPNPDHNKVGDCVIRGISKLTGESWDDIYLDIAIQGFIDKDMPSSNAVWDSYLRNNGYAKYVIPNTCPNCYTMEDFAEDHPIGKFLLCTGKHVVCLENGCLFDTWDSSSETPLYYYEKQEV